MSKHKVSQEDVDELRKVVPEGTTVFLIVRRVSASGMSRVMTPVVFLAGRPLEPARLVCRVLGLAYVAKEHGFRVHGCGMDMGFHVVDGLSHALYGAPGKVTHEYL